MDELLGEFVAETLETLATVASEVVAWEADPTDRERLDAFFRFFHTVKGSAGFLNLPRFERLSHGAEDVLSDLRDGRCAPDSAVISAVLAIMDRIGAMATALNDGTPPPDEAGDAILLTRLTAAATALPAEETAAAPHDPLAAHRPSESPGAVRDPAQRTIRISLALIDQLMNGVSDMVLARNELARTLRDCTLDADIGTSFERLSGCIADMRDTVSKTRMQRMDRLFTAIPRMVRDLSLELGKTVDVVVDGGDVEMDREMIEMVLDPLTHLVRNAIDHGIETPPERIAAGKSPTGHFRIAAQQAGNQIVLQLIDDGRGIDGAALAEKAVAMGVLTPVQSAALTDQQRIELLFHAGLSTARKVSSISGRGVGMDVVRTNVERIGGIVDIESQPGRGTKIELRVPMTLTIIPGLIVRCGTGAFAVPQGSVVELIRENNPTVHIETVCGAQIATIRGVRYPMVDLETVLGEPRATGADDGGRTLMLVRTGADHIYALGVDAVKNNEELVIRPAPPAVMAAGLFAGITLPDNGRPMLLLDAVGIAASAHLDLGARTIAAQGSTVDQEQPAAVTMQGLHFVDMTGRHRLIALETVERLEDVPLASFKTVDGRSFLNVQGTLTPVIGLGEAPGDMVKALMLSVGTRLCYPAREVIDIIDVPVQPQLAFDGNGIAGVIVHDGQSIEVIDTHALFAEVARFAAPPAGKGTCFVESLADDPWMRQILAPLLARAGYDVRDAGDVPAGRGAEPHVVIRRAGSPTMPAEEATILLSDDTVPDTGAVLQNAGPPAVYLYDRQRLFATIRDLIERQAA